MELAILLRNGKHLASGTGAATIRYALKCDQFSIQLAKTPIQIPVPRKSPEIIDLGIFRPSISIAGIVDNIGQDTSNTLLNNAGTVSQSSGTVQGSGTSFDSSLVGATINFANGGGLISAVNVGSQQLTVPAVGSPVGGGTSYTITNTGYENMESITVSRKGELGENGNAAISLPYYLPYKNKLEEFAYKQITSDATELQLEVGDAEYPSYDRRAGGATETTGDVNETGGGIYVVSIQQARFQVDPATEDRWTFQMQFVSEARDDVSF